jgi:hypothetical protein
MQLWNQKKVGGNCAPEENPTKKVDVRAFSLILSEVIAGKMDVVAVKVKERLERAIAVGQSRLGSRWPSREF